MYHKDRESDVSFEEYSSKEGTFINGHMGAYDR